MPSDDIIQEIYACLIPFDVRNEILSCNDDNLNRLRYRLVSKQWKTNFDKYLNVHRDNFVNRMIGYQVPGEDEEDKESCNSTTTTTIPTFALPMIQWKQDSFTTIQPSSSHKHLFDYDDDVESMTRKFTTVPIDNDRLLLLTKNLAFLFDKRTKEWNAVIAHHSEWNVTFLHDNCDENDLWSEAFYCKECVYVFGTEDSDGGVVVNLSTLKCDHEDSLRKRRIGSALVMVDDEDGGGFVYCFGGYDGERILDRYDVSSRKWTDDDHRPRIPHECRCGHTATMVGRKIYVVDGGTVDGSSNTRIQIYDLDSQTWNVVVSNAFHWRLRYGFGSAVAVGSASILFLCAPDEKSHSTVVFNTQTHVCSPGPQIERSSHTVQNFNDGTVMAVSILPSDNYNNGVCEIKTDVLRTFTKKKETKENHNTQKYDFQSYSTKEFALVSDNGPVLNRLTPKLRNDKDVVQAAIRKCGDALQYSSSKLKNSKEIVLIAVGNYGTALRYASPRLQNDKDVVLAAVRSTRYSDEALHYASDELKKDEDVVLAAVHHNSSDDSDSGKNPILYTSKEFRNDKDKMLKVVRVNGDCLQYLSIKLRNDRDVVLVAVSNCGTALYDAANEFLNDRDIVLAAVTNNYAVLDNVTSVDLKNDKEIVMAAVRQNGHLSCYAWEELKNDKDVVLTVVRNVGDAIQYASEELQNDRDVVLAAVGRDGDALGYVSDELRNDRDIVLAAVSNKGYAIRYAPEIFRKDREIVLTAVRNDVPPKPGKDRDDNALGYACDEFHNDKEVVIAAVTKVGDALGYASDALLNEKDVVLAAVRNSGSALEYASDELQNDKDVVLAAVNTDGGAFHHASEELQDDRDVVLAAVGNEGHTLEYMSSEFQSDREIALAAVSNDSYALTFVSEELTNDREIVLAAISLCGDALYDASAELQEDRDMLIEAKSNGYVRY